MSTPTSDTATLTGGMDDRDLDHDVPIRVDEFLQHARRWKHFLGYMVLSSLGMEIWATVEGVGLNAVGHKTGKRAVMTERVGDIAGMVIMVNTTRSPRRTLMIDAMCRALHACNLPPYQKVACRGFPAQLDLTSFPLHDSLPPYPPPPSSSRPTRHLLHFQNPPILPEPPYLPSHPSTQHRPWCHVYLRWSHP